jgi:hypothetical protein
MMRRFSPDRLFIVILALCIGGCASTKTADEFLDDYCKCVRSAPNAEESKKCEVDMVRSMALQMKGLPSNSQQREQMEATIHEASMKLAKMRKKCGGDTAGVSVPPR